MTTPNQPVQSAMDYQAACVHEDPSPGDGRRGSRRWDFTIKGPFNLVAQGRFWLENWPSSPPKIIARSIMAGITGPAGLNGSYENDGFIGRLHLDSIVTTEMEEKFLLEIQDRLVSAFAEAIKPENQTAGYQKGVTIVSCQAEYETVAFNPKGRDPLRVTKFYTFSDPVTALRSAMGECLPEWKNKVRRF